jgi:hypothetical protein
LTLRAGERRDVKVVDLVAELPSPATVVSAEDPSKSLAGAIYGAVAIRAADPALVVSYATGSDASLRWSACATSANRRWIVPSGNTQKDASLQLVITNPFDDVATVDLAVRTEAGFVEPPDFSGLVINPHSIRVINVGDHVRRRETVAVDTTVRNGRAVMSWMQLPASGAATSGLASSGASATLRWTGLEFADNVSYGLWVYNPSIDQPSSVEITPLFEGGEAFPFVVDLGPTEQRFVDLSTDPRIVKNVPVTLDLRVVSGAPVAGQLSFSGADNSVRLGRDVSGGVPVDAHRWIVPVVQATDAMTTSLNVYNPNDVAIAFTVREYVGADQLDFGVPQTTNRIVEAGGTLVVPLNKMRADSSAVSVESTGAIVVVAQYDAIGTPASSQTLGVVVR